VANDVPERQRPLLGSARVHGDGAAGDRGQAVIDLYRRTGRGDPQDIVDALISTDHMWMDSVHIAERKVAGGPAPVWMYQFAYRSDAVGGRLRAAHGLEVPFVFNDVERVKTTGTRPERFQVADAMSSAWLAFARHGDPNHPGIPTWTPYSPRDRTTMVFDAPCHVAEDPTELRQGLDALGIEFARQA
jgi:para-nitrobenzyl esterase